MSRSTASAQSTAPLKVLFIIDSIWSAAGAERSLLHLVRSLPPERYQSRVITFHTHAPARPFLDEFPCPVEHWPLRSLLHISALPVAWRLAQLVRREKIDIVHTFFPTSDLWAAPIARLAGARILVSSRRDMGLFRKPWQDRAYRLLHALYDQVQTVSEEVSRYTFEHDGVDPSRLVTVYNGVTPLQSTPAEIEQLRSELACPEGSLIVATVCNVRRVKGLDILLRAAVEVRRQVPNVCFLVAGSLGGRPEQAAYARELQQLATQLGSESSVRFLGAGRSVGALLAISDIFALPSRSEGLSNALLEAMAAGLPCVATSVGGTPEVIEHGTSGLLVPPDSTVHLTDALLQLLGDAGLRSSLGAAARSRVLDRFSIAAMTERVHAGYQAALNRR